MRFPFTRPAFRFALCLLLLGLPLAASAGEGRHGRGQRNHDPEARLERLTEHLSLSSEQQAELRPILEQQAESFRAIRERKQAGETRGQLRSDVRAQREANTTEIEAILDEQQLAEYRELRSEREAKRREHQHAKGAPEDTL